MRVPLCVCACCSTLLTRKCGCLCVFVFAVQRFLRGSAGASVCLCLLFNASYEEGEAHFQESSLVDHYRSKYKTDNRVM